MNKYFSFIDLFSGIGGFKIALTNNGGNCLGFSEINSDAIKFYCKNFNENKEKNFGDITKIQDLPKHDLLTAGVPCQSWSIAGRNLGFDDDRGKLWNDTIYLLQKAKPKAFIFENVKGLVEPRNKEALDYILNRIEKSGYYADYYVIDSHDYGIPQSRVRVYIIGFKEKEFFQKFKIPAPSIRKKKLADILGIKLLNSNDLNTNIQRNLFGEVIPIKSMSLSSKNGFNDYFLFNDLRNGNTTIHSWDILETSKRQKYICYTLLKNRRKSRYGKLDGNPLSLEHFRQLDTTISQEELDELINLKILKEIEYIFLIKQYKSEELSKDEKLVISFCKNNQFSIDELKINKEIKLNKISIPKIIKSLKEKCVIECLEIRYDFKNTKISTGLFGVNRIFLPSSDIFPTLVASDTNDYIALKSVEPKNKEHYKQKFLEDIYKEKNFRKITKKEACLIQGFPEDFILPDSRARWMKLIGNSVSIPVIDKLCKAILETGIVQHKQQHNKSEFELSKLDREEAETFTA